jgi:hypothetical protein
VNYMYVKNSSPTVTRQVVNNLIDAMTEADLDVIHVDTLRAIVTECDKVLREQAAAR